MLWKIISVFVAAIAITLAATVSGESGPFFGIMAPFSAEGMDGASKDLTGLTLRDSSSRPPPSPPVGRQDLSCWDSSIDGRVFSISCTGVQWYAWADCSNGYRYTAGPVSGTYRVAITCPVGSDALRGDAYGSFATRNRKLFRQS